MTKPLSLSALAQVAENATDGPWYAGAGYGGIYGVTPEGDPGDVVCGCPDQEHSRRKWPLNSEHISTFDPPTVKRLLAIAEAARSVVLTTEPRPGFAVVCADQAVVDALRNALTGITE